MFLGMKLFCFRIRKYGLIKAIAIGLCLPCYGDFLYPRLENTHLYRVDNFLDGIGYRAIDELKYAQELGY